MRGVQLGDPELGLRARSHGGLETLHEQLRRGAILLAGEQPRLGEQCIAVAAVTAVHAHGERQHLSRELESGVGRVKRVGDRVAVAVGRAVHVDLDPHAGHRVRDCLGAAALLGALADRRYPGVDVDRALDYDRGLGHVAGELGRAPTAAVLGRYGDQPVGLVAVERAQKQRRVVHAARPIRHASRASIVSRLVHAWHESHNP